MQPILSRTTTERIVRTAFPMLLASGFAVAFLWDGHIGYARDNVRQLVRSLGLDPDAARPVNRHLSAAEADRLARTIHTGEPFAAVTAVLGEPTFVHGEDAYYVGPAGSLRVRYRRERVEQIGPWKEGVHNETDLATQRWIGYALALVGLALVAQFARVVTMRVTLTDAGLKVRGRPVIPFQAMRSIRMDEPGKSGTIDLAYSIDGRDAVLRLDDYVIKELPAIVAEICKRKGFTDPRRDAADAGPS